MNGLRLVLLSGSRGVGKDTFASIAREVVGANQVVSVSVAAWFKSMLSGVLGIPIEDFYNDRRNVLLHQSIRLDGAKLGSLVSSFTTIAQGLGHETQHIANKLLPYMDQDFKSIRSLLEWWGFTIVHQMYGDDTIHCGITLDEISRVLTTKPQCTTVVITDARTYYENDYFTRHWQFGSVTKILIKSKAAPEPTVKEIELLRGFPPGYWHYEVDNPAPDLGSYTRRVADILASL